LSGGKKEFESIDYTKDKDAADTVLPQNAVYLPDPKVFK